MASSDFWRELAKEFRAIPSGWALAAFWECIIGDDPVGTWKITGTVASIRGFESLARRAATGIATEKTTDLLIAWLDALKQEGYGFKVGPSRSKLSSDGSRVINCLTGTIQRVARVSAIFCQVLESRAVQLEFEEKQRDDPKNWSPLRRQVEALEKIKGLVSGPHKQIPESLVRQTLAQQFGIRPEEVTSWQIRHAVADLLPYYPAITLIPSTPIDSPSLPRSEAKSGEIESRLTDRTKKHDLSRYFDSAKLTERQYQCASLRWEYELSVSAIARELHLSRKTVDQHLSAVQKKMQVSGQYERVKKGLAKFNPEEE
jgi:DNA-binding CsgD family transcriptional regulator